VAGSPEWPLFKSRQRFVPTRQLRNYSRGGKLLNDSCICAGGMARMSRASLAPKCQVGIESGEHVGRVWTGHHSSPSLKSYSALFRKRGSGDQVTTTGTQALEISVSRLSNHHPASNLFSNPFSAPSSVASAVHLDVVWWSALAR
jgi:hypothetical protein